MATVADLEALIGPPTSTPPGVDWVSIEAESGLVFPSDYKDFARRYAELTLDGFLDIYHLGIPANPHAMLAELEKTLEPLRRLTEGRDGIDLIDDYRSRRRVPPFPIYPARNGLFPWGGTDNGNYCLWLTNPDSGAWTIVITDGGLWWHFEGGFISFLVGVLNRSLRCPVLPSKFPRRLDNVEERGL